MSNNSKWVLLECYRKSRGKSNCYFEEGTIEFLVPYNWLQKYLDKNYDNMSVSEFLNTYTWDNSTEIRYDAEADRVFRYKNRISKKNIVEKEE